MLWSRYQTAVGLFAGRVGHICHRRDHRCEGEQSTRPCVAGLAALPGWGVFPACVSATPAPPLPVCRAHHTMLQKSQVRLPQYPWWFAGAKGGRLQTGHCPPSLAPVCPPTRTHSQTAGQGCAG